MRLERVVEFLNGCENAKESADGLNINVRCPFCGGSDGDPRSLSIKIDVKHDEPLWYHCFRASCEEKGILNTRTLQLLGCVDMDTLLELARHNAKVGSSIDKPFQARKPRDYVMVNLPGGDNREKLAYIQRRLGIKIGFEQLKDLKIQLSLLEMLRVNDIKRLSASEDEVRNLDVNSIGFISAYSDYMICRNIRTTSKKNRYYTYRLSGKVRADDLRVYTIPRELDIMDPKSAIINVAEGPFSILGAYLNTDIGAEHRNSLWAANCGSEYHSTIMQLCKQYGFLKCRINIWSDSEIPVSKYKKLYRSLQNRLDIRRFTVYYNEAAEDFGHARRDISIQRAVLK